MGRFETGIGHVICNNMHYQRQLWRRHGEDIVRGDVVGYVPAGEQLVLELFVRDAARSRDFYRALGFEVVRDSGTFVVLAWEENLLLLEERPGVTAPGSPAANIRVLVADADAHWDRVRAAGMRIVVPIADRSYQLRDFTVADPDGFGVRFASRIGGEPRQPGT